ncbi:MAG: hypothetical protein V3T30_08290 [Thermodesulfobacteriota bacterium]
MIDVLKKLGLEDVKIVRRFDCFRSTSKEGVARKFGVHGANVFARKPIPDVGRT